MLVTTLEDGSVVYLAQESTLQYPEHFATDKREVNLPVSYTHLIRIFNDR